MKAVRSVLVTGGNGFIGRHLVRRLLSDGCRVALLQRSGERVDPRTELLHVERLAPEDIAAALEDRQFDWLFHLAGYGVDPADRDVETLFRVNVDVTRALVNIAATWPLRALVIAGSGSEYKLDGVAKPVTEDCVLEPCKLYGASKAAGTLCATALASARGTPLAVCRLFAVYGPGEAPYRLLPSLIKGLRGGGRVSLSEGRQQRDFLFIDDAVEALVRTALALDATPKQLIVNVATGRPVSVREFSRTVAATLNVPDTHLGFGDVPMRPDETMMFSGNPARLQELTGWKPAIELRDGIRRCLELEFSTLGLI